MVKEAGNLPEFTQSAMALAMIAAFLLGAGGLKLALAPQTRGRAALMLIAAVVLIMNVMIWTM